MKEIEIELVQGEQIVFSNSIGTITYKRIAVYNVMNRLKGGERKDFPKKEITSVAYNLVKRPGKGFVLCLFGVVFTPLVFGIFMFINGVRNFKGRPTITIKTSDSDSTVIVGNPGRKSEAEAFVGKLRLSMLQ